ncbi:MAG: hypothetical protein ACYCVZ_18530 [Streptosporangiaceae bacterium]
MARPEFECADEAGEAEDSGAADSEAGVGRAPAGAEAAVIPGSQLLAGDRILVDGREVTVTRIEFPVAFWDEQQREVTGIGVWYEGNTASGVLRCAPDRPIRRVT